MEKQENNNIPLTQPQNQIKSDYYRNPKSKESIFVLCEKCHWCATYLNRSWIGVDKCLQCLGTDLSSFPILPDEAFTFDYDVKHGTELRFARRRKTIK